MTVRIIAGWSTMLGHEGIISRPADNVPDHVMVVFPDDPEREYCFGLDEIVVLHAA